MLQVKTKSTFIKTLRTSAKENARHSKTWISMGKKNNTWKNMLPTDFLLNHYNEKHIRLSNWPTSWYQSKKQQKQAS